MAIATIAPINTLTALAKCTCQVGTAKKKILQSHLNLFHFPKQPHKEDNMLNNRNSSVLLAESYLGTETRHIKKTPAHMEHGYGAITGL